MNKNTSYNGWTNRATWLVKVWFNPESVADVESTRETLEDAADAVPDFMRDFLCTSDINWDELASHCTEEGDEA